MKKVLWIVVCAMIAIAAQAKEITEQQALQKAQAFWQGKVFTQSTEAKSMRRAPQALAQSDAYYVFNVEKNGGFVIIAGDDAVDPVIGYATEGNFDSNDMPENMRSWLEGMAKESKAIASEAASDLSDIPNAPSRAEVRRTSPHMAIEPLIITTWNQGNNSYNEANTDGIYNIKCPKIGGQYPCTGCVATAGAQLMYYYKYPQAATTVVPGYESSSNANTSANLPPIQFKWDKMKTRYTSSDAYSEEAEAVADLMLYCGYAAQMKYGVGASGASTYYLAKGMAEYFDYDPNTWKGVDASDYSIAEWDEMMYNELAHARPIIYSGNSNDGGGHAFICDGYDGEGFYHFNFGWGGGANGPYKLYAAEDYIKSHDAIIGLQPNTGVIPDDPNGDDEWEDPVIEGIVATARDASVDNTTISAYLQNGNSGKYALGLGIGELNENGTITVLDNSYENYKNWELSSGSYWTSRLEFNVANYSLPEGTHKLVPISIVKGETEWKRCRPADLWFEVNVAGGQTTVVQHPVENLQIDRFEMVSGGTPEIGQAFIVQVTNNGDNIEKSLYLYEDNNGAYASRHSLKIKAGNTKEFRMSTGTMAAGTHVMRLLNGYNGDEMAQIKVDIKVDLAATKFDVPVSPKFSGNSLPLDVTIENRAGDYIQPLYLFASNDPDSKGSSPVYVAGSGIEGGSSDAIRFYFTPETAGTWYFWVSTASSPADESLIGQGSVVIEEVPTGTVALQLTDKQIICEPNGKVTYKMTVKNTGDVTNYNGFFVYLWAPTTGSSWSTMAYCSTPAQIIEPGKSATVSVSFEGLTDGSEYSFDPYYYTTYQKQQRVRFNPVFYTDEFTYQSPSIQPGDSNGDGVVDINDALAIFNYVIGKPASTFNAAAADMNGDGTVDIADAVKIVNILMGKE